MYGKVHLKRGRRNLIYKKNDFRVTKKPKLGAPLLLMLI